MLNIKVVGSGCPNCKKLEELVHEVVEGNNINADIEKITDFTRFAELGIVMTPGLLLNDKVVSSGKIPTKSTLLHWVNDANRME